ncbi:MAG TPA: MaoC family dehydratase N-terminal domain-containing protein [Acidimicrobiales bacterium]|nr:MaoC family dehydratase N-terminal domain-containing protein [Acidimicrobiales bacterium]
MDDVKNGEPSKNMPFEIAVTSEDIRAFARATKAESPEYFTDSPVMPVTFLNCTVRWQKPENNPYGDVPRDLSHMVHGGQEYVFYGPSPKAGTTLTGQSRIERVYEKVSSRSGTMRFTESVYEYRDATGRLVAEARGVHIELGVEGES